MSLFPFPVGLYAGATLTRANAMQLSGTAQRLNFTAATNSTERLHTSISVWVRLRSVGAVQPIWSVDNGTGGDLIYVNTAGEVQYDQRDGAGTLLGTITGSTVLDAETWYHVFIVFDHTLTPTSEKMKIFLNGVEDATNNWNYGVSFGLGTLVHAVGWHANSGAYLAGDLSLFHFVDGTSLPVSTFAETIDGIYQAKIPFGLTYQQNGFFLSFQDASNLGADSDNGNDYTPFNVDATNGIGDGPYLSGV